MPDVEDVILSVPEILVIEGFHDLNGFIDDLGEGEFGIHLFGFDDFNDVFIQERIVEDVKGIRTQLYILKKRLMKAILGIEVEEP